MLYKIKMQAGRKSTFNLQSIGRKANKGIMRIGAKAYNRYTSSKGYELARKVDNTVRKVRNSLNPILTTAGSNIASGGLSGTLASALDGARSATLSNRKNIKQLQLYGDSGKQFVKNALERSD